MGILKESELYLTYTTTEQDTWKMSYNWIRLQLLKSYRTESLINDRLVLLSANAQDQIERKKSSCFPVSELAESISKYLPIEVHNKLIQSF